MAYILSLETSTNICSVAIHLNGNPLAYSEIQIEKSHAEKITILAEQTIRNAKLSVNQLDAIAISKGPGSYTGLRIASSTAKGFCYALDKPLIGISTLQSMALNFKIKDMLVCPMIDARRMEVYCGIYNADNQEITPMESKIIDSGSFNEILKTQKILFCGNGAEKVSNIQHHPNAIFVSSIYPSANQVGILAWQKFKTNDFEDLVNFEPLYLKEFYMAKAKEQSP